MPGFAGGIRSIDDARLVLVLVAIRQAGLAMPAAATVGADVALGVEGAAGAEGTGAVWGAAGEPAVLRVAVESS